jgi:protein involved in polysaccharide export with SLBB domain
LPATRAAPSAIRAGERLRVTLVDPDAFDLRTQHDVTVDPTGGIALPSLERVDAAGQSVDGLRRAIAEAYQSAKLIRRPVVKVESIQSGARSKEPADPSQLLDLYVVIRRPTTAPAATQPTSMPTTTDAP